jgi:uncharacterized protein (DUF58 family)
VARRGRGPSEQVHVELTGGAVGILVVAGGALLAWLLDGGDLQLAAGVAMLVALVTDGALARAAVRRGRVDLVGPLVIEADRPSTWTATVADCRRPASLRFLLVGTSQDVLAVDARPGRLVVPPLPRGAIPFLVADLKARGPLGLVGAGRRLVVTFEQPIPVIPVAVPVDLRWPSVRARAFGTHEGAPVGDDLFRTIRPYQRGDERRRVHWKATAHHGQLMVRESDGLGIVRVRVAVDLGAPGPVAEHVAGVAQHVTTEALRRGWQVELVTLDATGRVPYLSSLGRTFGPPPTVTPPPITALPTVDAPVRTHQEVGRRLAQAAYGSPVVAEGRHDVVCRIDPAGVHWS